MKISLLLTKIVCPWCDQAERIDCCWYELLWSVDSDLCEKYFHTSEAEKTTRTWEPVSKSTKMFPIHCLAQSSSLQSADWHLAAGLGPCSPPCSPPASSVLRQSYSLTLKMWNKMLYIDSSVLQVSITFCITNLYYKQRELNNSSTPTSPAHLVPFFTLIEDFFLDGIWGRSVPLPLTCIVA